MKLGLGELEQADSAGYSRQFTQTRFLIIAEKTQPQILLEALSGPYPLFRNLLNSIPRVELGAFFNKLNAGWRWLEGLAGGKAFLDSLLQWAKHWNLEADWCIARTILAMRRYCGIKPTPREFSFFNPLYTTVPTEDGKKYKDTIDFLFDLPILDATDVYDSALLNPPPPPAGWPVFDPYLCPLKEGYLTRIEWEARERLENDPYLSVVERSHREAYVRLVKMQAAEYAERVMICAQSQSGLKQVKTKLKLRTHLEWTVQVWVLGMNFSEVARSAEPKPNGKGLTWKAVQKAVKEILDLIEPEWASQLEDRFPPGGQKKSKSEPKPLTVDLPKLSD